MIQGECIQLSQLGEGFVELRFDRRGKAINKFDKLTLDELREATSQLASWPGLRGVLVTSAKDVFIVGADITEFGEIFSAPESEIAHRTMRSNEIFNAFEDLPVPSVVALNGLALGGGFEFALANAGRMMSSKAQVGLPEVKLGLIPGLGGTARLPRVAGAEVALEWITSGQPVKAGAALEAGVIDAVFEPAELRDSALAWLRKAAAGDVDWQARQAAKRASLPPHQQEVMSGAVATRVVARPPRHQPASRIAVGLLSQAAGQQRDGAVRLEAEAFARVAHTQAAGSLVQVFLNEQALKKLARLHREQARPVNQAAVLGAGIMGGGIAYASAANGVPVRMKDISAVQLDAGMAEVGRQLTRQVTIGRMAPDHAERARAAITPQLDDEGFEKVDLVVEAVVERIEVKRSVLAALEGRVRANTVIASNTSSLLIDDVGAALVRPQNFVGMHFFNPVPVMPLVEIIKGSRTSDAAVSTAVGYAVAMGKTPIVVKDCPGFLVNRILTAYIRAFLQLVSDGADFTQVDRAMEEFGWPMGPAYLEDVIGIDTGSHVTNVISAGYADRMPALSHDALHLMASRQRYGQKNGIGFYRYEMNQNGKPKRLPTADSHALLAHLQSNGQQPFDDPQIVERMMLPLIVEAAHALEEGVVAGPGELDMAMLLGAGFPAYLGGPLKYADWLGLALVLRSLERYAHLGVAYQPTARMKTMAATGRRYYDH